MTPKGYSRTQILLHWAVAALVALQVLLNESISEAWEKIEDGVEAVTGPLVTQHVLTGHRRRAEHCGIHGFGVGRRGGLGAAVGSGKRGCSRLGRCGGRWRGR